MTEHFSYSNSHSCHYAIPDSSLGEVFTCPSSAHISAIRSVKPEPKSHADRLKNFCNSLYAQALIPIACVLDLFNMGVFEIRRPVSLFSQAEQPIEELLSSIYQKLI